MVWCCRRYSLSLEATKWHIVFALLCSTKLGGKTINTEKKCAGFEFFIHLPRRMWPTNCLMILHIIAYWCLWKCHSKSIKLSIPVWWIILSEAISAVRDPTAWCRRIQKKASDCLRISCFSFITYPVFKFAATCLQSQLHSCWNQTRLDHKSTPTKKTSID